MTSLVQGLKQAFSSLNREMITQAYPFLKGHAVEFLSTASAHMRQSMSAPFTAPYTAILTANTLFYALFSCTVGCLESRSDRSDPTHKQKNVCSLKSIVALGALTAMFNVCIFRLAHQQLNRLALFTITAAVLDCHVLFNSVSASLRNRGNSDEGKVPSLLYKMRLPSSYSINLEGTPFTQEDLEYLIRGIRMQDYKTLFTTLEWYFIQEIKDLSRNAALACLDTLEGRRNCFDSMIRTFNERVEGRWVNDGGAKDIFQGVLKHHVAKLSANQPVVWQEIQQTQNDLRRDESYRALIEMGFNGEQLVRLVRIATMDASALLTNILSVIRDNHTVLPQTDENKRFLLDIVISAYKMNSAMAKDVTSAATIANLSLWAVRDANALRGKNSVPISPAHERLLMLQIEPEELKGMDDACFDAIDEYLRHLFTFIEPYTFEHSKMKEQFVFEARDRSGTIENLKEFLRETLTFEHLKYFGFTETMLANFIERLQKSEFNYRVILEILDSCLCQYYTDRTVLPGPNEEKQKFLDYIITQFYRGLPVDRELEEKENFILMKRIVDHAIAHPEIFRIHKLFPGEPGYVGFQYSYRS